MPLVGFRLTEARSGAHSGQPPVLEVLRLGIPDEAIDAAIAEAGAQEQRLRLLPAWRLSAASWRTLWNARWCRQYKSGA